MRSDFSVSISPDQLIVSLNCIAHVMIAGWVAAASTAVGGAIINDLFLDRERAVAMSVYVAGPLVGAYA